MDAVEAIDTLDPIVVMTYCHLVVTVCAILGVIYGAVFLLKESKALYTKMIFWAVVCAFISRLFLQSMLFYYQWYSMNISIGTIGLFGSLFFLLSANFGQINKLVDDGSKRCNKAKLIALTGPLLLIVGYVIFLIVAPPLWKGLVLDTSLLDEIKIEMGIMTVILMPCVYFNLKHAIIYDVEGGLVRSLRRYNLLALLYELFLYTEYVAARISPGTAPLLYVSISLVLQGVVLLLMLPALRKGMKSFKTGMAEKNMTEQNIINETEKE